MRSNAPLYHPRACSLVRAYAPALARHSTAQQWYTHTHTHPAPRYKQQGTRHTWYTWHTIHAPTQSLRHALTPAARNTARASHPGAPLLPHRSAGKRSSHGATPRPRRARALSCFSQTLARVGSYTRSRSRLPPALAPPRARALRLAPAPGLAPRYAQHARTHFRLAPSLHRKERAHARMRLPVLHSHTRMRTACTYQLARTDARKRRNAHARTRERAHVQGCPTHETLAACRMPPAAGRLN
jgi:hypothetical protein